MKPPARQTTGGLPFAYIRAGMRTSRQVLPSQSATPTAKAPAFPLSFGLMAILGLGLAVGCGDDDGKQNQDVGPQSPAAGQGGQGTAPVAGTGAAGAETAGSGATGAGTGGTADTGVVDAGPDAGTTPAVPPPQVPGTADGGLGGTDGGVTPPTAENTGPFLQIEAGEDSTCALLPTGRVACAGELGQAVDQPRLEVLAGAAGEIFVDLSAGDQHLCAVTEDGQAYCLGENDRGQLGFAPGPMGSRNEVEDFRVLPRPADGVRFADVTAGEAHTCAVTDKGEAYCWGYNDEGQLGLGPDVTDETVTSPKKVVLPPGVTLVSIEAGYEHTCALATDQQLYCWGRGDHGQLGRNRGDDADTSPVPAPVFGLTDVTAYALGDRQTCAATANGDAYCWGDKDRGALGTPRTTYATAPIKVPLSDATPVIGLSAGWKYACALLANGAVHCWGEGRLGQLGRQLPAGTETAPPTAMPLPEGFLATGLTAGDSHACAHSTTDGTALCWGWNDDGALGRGAETSEALPAAPVQEPVP